MTKAGIGNRRCTLQLSRRSFFKTLFAGAVVLALPVEKPWAVLTSFTSSLSEVRGTGGYNISTAWVKQYHANTVRMTASEVLAHWPTHIYKRDNKGRFAA